MSPLLRVNISIPSDFYSECLQYCKERKSSFSQMVRTALMNQINGVPPVHTGFNEQDIIEIIHTTVYPQICDLQKKVADIELKYDELISKYDSIIENQDSQNYSESHLLTNKIEPDRWYAQHEIVNMLDPSIPINTRKGMVSKAVAAGKFEINGEKGKHCRIRGSSAIEWLTKHTFNNILSI